MLEEPIISESFDINDARTIWTPAERLAWALPAKLTVSEWADRFRILDKSSAEPGQWRTDRNPVARAIQDAFTDPGVRTIAIVACTQLVKTSAMLNMLGYCIDQDPGPTLWVAPREDDAKWFAYNRARPMLDDSPALARHKPTVSDDLTRLEWNLPRMFVRFVGANSPAALSQMPIRYLFLDEVDKYPAFSGREADPIKLASERQGTFWNAKSVLASTPTTRNGNVWKYYEQSQQLVCHVPCPHCGRWLVMSLAQTKWPGGADPAGIRRHKLAWYECQHCGGRIDDLVKLQMLARCVWAPRDHRITEDDIERGHVPFDSQVGFWLPRFYSPWLSGTSGSIACEFLQSKGDPPRLMNFVNSWLAETWQEKVEANTTDALAEHQAGYPQGMVAQGAMVLTAGVDVQMSCIYFVIRAWGAGWESWLVRAGRVETWQELEAMCSTFNADFRAP